MWVGSVEYQPFHKQQGVISQSLLSQRASYIKYLFPKREVKETDNKPILTKAIKTIANENIKQIHKWKEQYPDCSNSNSKKNDLFLKIVSNSMNGLTIEEGEKNINKIISKVAKETAIDK